MADVKVPALLHKMSKAAQKAWYKKNNMAMPDDAGGRSAAAAKRVKVAPRKEIAVEPNSVRAINAAKQKAYMAKGGRQPIGAAGSGGHSSMAGSNMSTAKGIVAGIKAGYNPKVSLDPYESEKAKKVGPRSLKLKKESVDEASRIDLIKRAAASNRMGKSTFLSKVNARAAQLAQQKRDDKVTKSKVNFGMSNEPVPYVNEEVQIDEVTKTEAEAMLGGPVKEKPKMPPGKQPAGYRYVRNLARKAMKKGMSVSEEIKDTADVGEYDYEGDMAKSQLRSIMANSKRMHDMLEENTNLPEWVQSKITLAEDYISTASNYMQGEMNEEAEQIDELKKSTLKSYVKKASGEMKKAHDYHQMRYGGRDGTDQNYMKNVYPKAIAKYDRRDAGVEKAKQKLAKEEAEQVDEKINLAKAKMGDVVKDFYKSKAPQFKGKSMAKRREMAVAAKLGAEREAGMREEVVTEAEGTVAVTPKEKSLAAHHGDPKKITYGDVIKARLKSAAAKKMGK